MGRIYARQAAAGFMPVRGTLVYRTQKRLTQHGFSTRGIDGIFGRGTHAALSAFQKSKGFPDSGALDDETWPALFPTIPSPTDFDLALALTSTFEGHGFQKAVGNFDGAGLTWGIIGFTLTGGELATVLNAIETTVPDSLDTAFGAMASELRDILNHPLADQITWANSISLGPQKVHLREDWASGFSRLGATEAAQNAQIDRARARYWTIAQRDAALYDLTDPPGLALCFDIAVQNGSINEGPQILEALAAEIDPTPRRRREIIAEQVALGSRKLYQEDVRSRKMTLATGHGTVHGGRFNTADWGITELVSGNDQMIPRP
ncbi:MAG: peptidoglycan-binding protein [Alphaproteobacteria bacterium]|nr:peptidoglycan-binding protein [Alphaproteobacteria bacterium]